MSKASDKRRALNKKLYREGVQQGIYEGRRLDGTRSRGLSAADPAYQAFRQYVEEQQQNLEKELSK